MSFENIYFDEYGIARCKRCNERKETTIFVPAIMLRGIDTTSCNKKIDESGQIMIERKVVIACACEKQEYAQKNTAIMNADTEREIASLKRSGFVDIGRNTDTFKDADTENGKEALEIATKYVENWEEYKRENIGLLLHGKPGTGKTFIASCIANEMQKKRVTVFAMSTDELINKIQKDYAKDRDDILQKIGVVDLLILDGLGAEYQSEYCIATLQSVIDKRYKSKKPLIITSNMDVADIWNPDEKLSGIYARIVEMCQPVEVRGENKRKSIAGQKARMMLDINENSSIGKNVIQ